MTVTLLNPSLDRFRGDASHVWQRFRIWKRVQQGGAPILVYQMGKVGSTSIEHSLKASVPNLCLHTHTLAETPVAREILANYALRGRPLYVISLVREPIGRNISSFFQNFEREVGTPFEEANMSTPDLIDRFLYRFPHETPLLWFQRNIERWLDIDVYAHSFPDSGIQFIEHGNTRLLLMRLTAPDEQKQDAIAELLGLDHFTITRSNVGAEKPYATAYSAFRDAFSAPEWMIRRLYDSTYFGHFYDDQEKARLIQKWT